MIRRADEIAKCGTPDPGKPELTIFKLNTFENQPEKLRTYALATVEPGGAVDFHVHEGECEYYYILSGTAEYNDNGTIVEVSAGDLTFTADGEGHGIKNIGDDPLIFFPLIIKY
ncbi:MAG: cupin domain-containing protein [Clostridia bacterium]|nr:cupin domain-containing protein [Clostridia bacterium]